MNDQYSTPTPQALEKGWMQKQSDETRKNYRKRVDHRRRAQLEQRAKLAERYNPNALVVIEYVGADRDELLRPIIWNIEGRVFGFWKNPRPTTDLEAWQERVPASHGLPRTDGSPHNWKLISDPRDGYVDIDEDTEPDIDTDTEIDTDALEIEYETLCAKILKKNGDYRKDASDENKVRHNELMEKLGLV